jgi:glycine cleavage system H protein
MDILELTVDKFTFRVPTDRLYSRDGVWVVVEGERVRVGLSDFAQQRSGDVAFATLTPVGEHVADGQDVASIETVKVDLALPTPMPGTVAEINEALETAPELVNQDPYGEGWLAVLVPDDLAAAREQLLSPEAYLETVRVEAEAEVA